MTVIDLVERNWIPDVLLRAGIRRQIRRRLRDLEAAARAHPSRWLDEYAHDLKSRPIAVHTGEANEQHYELPAAFFECVLGPRLKYSSGYYGRRAAELAEAEEAMLDLYHARAEIGPGQEILDLGCGWGSLSLYLAERHPDCRITALSNSGSQREFIEARARALGVHNVDVVTADIRDFEIDRKFDRVLSVEMFEHMKNYELLLRKVAQVLRPGGKLFVHVFAHRSYAYHFDAENSGEWMARHFFTGGQMPAHDLLPRFQDDLKLETSWRVPGTHYEETANAWLRNMDARRNRIMPILEATYGADADRWWRRWRLFFMACAELFGYDQGREWHVSHYRFAKTTP